MHIEVLYEELFIYGEKANIQYLKKMFKNAVFHSTSLFQQPYFVENRPDLIIIEPIAEHNLDKVVEKLYQYKDRLKELVEEGMFFIAINNSLDILGMELKELGYGNRKTLEIFNYTAVRNYDLRIDDLVAAEFNNTIVLGKNFTFSQYYGNENNYLYKTLVGKGFNQESNLGGYKYKNAYLIEFLGNIFLYNPQLSKMLLSKFGYDTNLPLEKEVFASYNGRIEKWRNNNII